MLNLIFSLKKECAKVMFIIYITNRVLEIFFTNKILHLFINFNKILGFINNAFMVVSVTFLKRASLITQVKSKLIFNEKNINIFYFSITNISSY